MGFFKAYERAELKYSVDKYIFHEKDAQGRNVYQFTYKGPNGDYITVLLKHIYTDKAGKKYYQFVNQFQMTMERNIASSVATREFNYNMTIEDLTDFCDDILRANNIRDFNTVATKANEIKTRALKLVEYETSLKLAAIYFLVEGEHPGRYNPLITEKKIEDWKKDDDARAFFLTSLWDMVKPYTGLSGEDLLDYLFGKMEMMKMMKKTEEAVSQESQQTTKSGSYNVPK